MKTIAFKTLGCKVNQYETQLIREQFLKAGFIETAAGADVYVINTCTVTGKADAESRRLARVALRENPAAEVIITGCYTELNSEELRKIPGNLRIVKNSEKESLFHNTTAISNFEGRTKAFVKVQDGCDNFCSYCKVPLVRGRSKSRKTDDILREIGRLVGSGYKEIVLTGICLGDWGRSAGLKITDLLEEIDSKITGTFRIRLSSIEPWYVTEALLGKIASSKRMCRHLHIPMQSGDDDVLKRMNRHFSSAGFIALINRFRSLMPQAAFTTDIMVGFPGETEDEFRNTLKAVELTRPSRTHIFPYSAREGTRAHTLGGFVPPKEVQNRIRRLKRLTDSLASDYRLSLCGEKAQVLVETQRDKVSGLLVGYTDTYVAVAFEGPDELAASLREVVLTNKKSYDILATRLEGAKEAIGRVYPQDKLDRCISCNCFSQK